MKNHDLFNSDDKHIIWRLVKFCKIVLCVVRNSNETSVSISNDTQAFRASLKVFGYKQTNDHNKIAEVC